MAEFTVLDDSHIPIQCESEPQAWRVTRAWGFLLGVASAVPDEQDFDGHSRYIQSAAWMKIPSLCLSGLRSDKRRNANGVKHRLRVHLVIPLARTTPAVTQLGVGRVDCLLGESQDVYDSPAMLRRWKTSRHARGVGDLNVGVLKECPAPQRGFFVNYRDEERQPIKGISAHNLTLSWSVRKYLLLTESSL